jgi:transcriptional regulator with XRE-family HTH domain
MSMHYAPLPTAPTTHDIRRAWAQLFGMFIQSIRKRVGSSMEEAASRIGMTVEEWEQVEAGTLLPNTPEQVRVLAYALDVEWESMVNIVLLCRSAWPR